MRPSTSAGPGLTARSGPETLAQDPRAVETRRRLVEAYLEVAPRRGPDLSVAELVAAAGVHRSSFYAHFAGLHELAMFVLDESLEPVHEASLRRHVQQTMTAQESNSLVIQQILQQVTGPSTPLVAFLHHDRAAAEQAFGSQLRGRVADYFDRITAYRALDEHTLTTAAQYVGHALSAAICAWLLGDLAVPEAELVDLHASLVPAWVMSPDQIVHPPAAGGQS